MRGWLDCIGRKYWPTPLAYIREARAIGITRRISLQRLRKMEFGDFVIGMPQEAFWEDEAGNKIPDWTKQIRMLEEVLKNPTQEEA